MGNLFSSFIVVSSLVFLCFVTVYYFDTVYTGRERLWPKSNSLCYIAGWGIIDPLKDQPRNDSMPSIYPKQLEIQLVNDDVCKRTMAQLHPFDKRKMCAGYK